MAGAGGQQLQRQWQAVVVVRGRGAWWRGTCSPMRATPLDVAAASVDPTVARKAVTSAVVAEEGAAAGSHQPELWEAFEEVAAEESASGTGAAVWARDGGGCGGVSLLLTTGGGGDGRGGSGGVVALLASVTATCSEPAAGGDATNATAAVAYEWRTNMVAYTMACHVLSQLHFHLQLFKLRPFPSLLPCCTGTQRAMSSPSATHCTTATCEVQHVTLPRLQAVLASGPAAAAAAAAAA